ncbi:hypothetical protein TRV_05567 [Trichophyton verrucosum HKI 0517]|uniref:Uncharacterized protein n=1 Tax=Trichophyton verrucosum (strain HKI 0517) TaxID=663202 RepID=D4DEK0_TRIVH|nr:uncharacterized protein TRV_05567 [Trichophyton verrucosum HKI 0517]EFE39724.1 hypothetical protein TRV_05567 [Trichophyton verrucosum HKI 0517]
MKKREADKEEEREEEEEEEDDDDDADGEKKTKDESFLRNVFRVWSILTTAAGGDEGETRRDETRRETEKGRRMRGDGE